jgi:hypothetical protein
MLDGEEFECGDVIDSTQLQTNNGIIGKYCFKK